MLKRNFVNLVILGVLGGVGVAQADNTAFPRMAENGPFEQYTGRIVTEQRTGAAQSAFPRAEIEPYVADQRAVEKSRSPSVGSRAVAPLMAETGPRI
jgi:hypothetical protein